MGIFSQTKEISLFEPKIEIKKGLKKIKITGVSRMPDPGEFYTNFTSMLQESFFSFRKTLFLEFYFDYINTGSSKWLFFAFQNLEKLFKEEGMIEITWKYDKDDEAIQETGEVFQSQLSIPFFLKSI